MNFNYSGIETEETVNKLKKVIESESEWREYIINQTSEGGSYIYPLKDEYKEGNSFDTNSIASLLFIREEDEIIVSVVGIEHYIK